MTVEAKVLLEHQVLRDGSLTDKARQRPHLTLES